MRCQIASEAGFWFTVPKTVGCCVVCVNDGFSAQLQLNHGSGVVKQPRNLWLALNAGDFGRPKIRMHVDSFVLNIDMTQHDNSLSAAVHV